MVIRNQTQSNCECDCENRYRAPEPVIPPIVPVVSVKSVNGYTGDVVLRNLTIGDKVYNGTDNVTVEIKDLGIDGMVDYKGQHESSYIEKLEVKQGDLYYCTNEDNFWLALAKGSGGFKKFPTLEELRRSAYKIELSITDDTYILTADLKDYNGNIISSSFVDLPIEGTIIERAYYDDEKKAIVIIFKNGDIVEIPVGELIKDLSDKLNQEIKDRQAGDAALAGAINKEITDRQEADTNITEALNTEATIRSTNDEALASSIRKEISDREAADINLLANINIEAATRESADNNLAGAINQEVADRKVAINQEVIDRDSAIQLAINQEVIDRNAAILVETDRAKAAELKEETERKAADTQEVINRDAAIKVESDRALAAEAKEVIDRNTAITTAINALDENINVGRNLITNIKETKGIISITTSKIEQSDVVGLESRLSESDTKLNRAISDIATEVGKREALDTKVNTISSKLDTEIQRSTEKDNDLDLSIKAETTRATGKESELSTAISTEKSRAEGAELTLTTNLNNEISLRVAGDNTLQTNLTSEVDRAKKAEAEEAKARLDKDTELASNISTLNTNLTNEVTTRTASDNEFRSAIIDLRAKDTELASSIIGEINRAKEAEQGLGNRITETNTALNSEISRASTAESALATSISKEVTDRTNADTVLATGLQSEQSLREAADTLEAQTRETADTALGARIDAITIPEYSMVNLGSTTAYAGRYQMTKTTKGTTEHVGVEIDVLRSNIIDDISVRTCYEKDVPIEGLNPGDKYLDFTYTVGGILTHAYIAVKDMMKPISAGDYIVIDDNNKISVSSILSDLVAQNTNNIVKEVADRTTAVTTEKNERTAADVVLQTNIDAEKARAMAEVAQERLDRDAAILVETNRAKDIEATKIDLLGTVPGTSISYNLPYYFYVDVQENKVVVHAKTISLDNQKTQGDYTLDVNAATQTTAGLLSKDDKIKLDKIKFVDTTIDERD